MNKPPGSQTFGNPLLAEAKRLRAKKRFSQNFLVDERVLEAITNTVDPKNSETVVEIGPGTGFLTEKLLPRAGHLTAVELERSMAKRLRTKYADQMGEGGRFELVEQDILRFNWESVAAPRFKVVGNLPYSITSPILFMLAGEMDVVDHPLRKRIIQATVMVQKEVGERMAAKPGCKAYNPLSIALQVWFDVKLEFVVPATAFYPPPKVDSAVVNLTPRPEPLVPVQDLPVMARMIDAAFAQRRKTVRNSLLQKSFAPPDVLDKLFVETGIDPGLRAEALSIPDFGALANAYSAHTRQG